MNERIRQLAEQAGSTHKQNLGVYQFYTDELDEFAQLIVRECARLNRLQSYELLGVITDVEEGGGFDDVCLNTVKRVAQHLANDLKEHFGVEL
jgi:hypothetical protein